MWHKLSILRLVMFLFIGMGFNASAFGAAASFMGLGDLAGGAFNSAATAVSDNGLVVVGSSESASGTEAFYWSLSQGMMGLGDLPGGSFYSVANDVSADGSVIVGKTIVEFDGDSAVEAFMWTMADGMLGLGDLPGGSHYSTANSISGDGTVIVGTSSEDDDIYGTRAFTWTASTGMESIGFPLFPNFPEQEGFSRGQAVSADGTTIVGESNYIPNYYLAAQAFRWTEGTDFTLLGGLPSDAHSPGSIAIAVSADGSVVVGSSSSDGGGPPVSETFYWTEDEGMVGIGFLPGTVYGYDNYAGAVSADGSVIVGHTDTDDPVGYQAYIWNADDGIRLLQDVLVDDLGLDLTGWTLTEATGISADGLTIVGSGINPNGDYEAFVVTLPEPGMLGLLGIGAVALLTRRVSA